MHSARVLSFAAVALLSIACSRQPQSRVRAAEQSDPRPRPAAVDGGGERYRVEAQSLDGFIQFQERMLSLQAQMLAELGRADAGSATVAAVQRFAQAQDGIRRELGLSERDVEQIESIVSDVISRRAALAGDDSEATLKEMEALAARLPVEQRAEFDATLAPLRRQAEQSRALTAERERHGAENVERVLAREAALVDQWNRSIAIFSGASESTAR